MTAFGDVHYEDRAVWLPERGTLVLADVHLGRARSSRVDLPIGSHANILERLDALLDRHDAEQVVIAGDLVHDFDSVSLTVAETVAEIVDLVEDRDADLVVTAGNHDTGLDRVTSIETVDGYRIDRETVVHHGHEIPETEASRYIIGHDHPAITIEGSRRPCYLNCPDQYEGCSVLVLPAFSRVAVGTTVNGRTAADIMTPLVTDLGSCRPIVRTDEEPLVFPPLGELQSHL
ncbi:MAG: metallophosphoesterase [Halodesulfurarchaeum sp.]|nr:metallophosphoesterase [Halodesulfurarchaeum sp.]